MQLYRQGGHVGEIAADAGVTLKTVFQWLNEERGLERRGPGNGKHVRPRIYSVKSCGRAHTWCRKCAPNAAAKQSARLQEQWARGKRCGQSGPPTGIQQKLLVFLKQAGFEGLRMEESFGRYRVDIYAPSHHLAFEADGGAWHENHPFRDQVTRDRKRDRILLEEHGLPVVRMSEADIEELAS